MFYHPHSPFYDGFSPIFYSKHESGYSTTHPYNLSELVTNISLDFLPVCINIDVEFQPCMISSFGRINDDQLYLVLVFDTIYGFGLWYDLWNGAHRWALIPWESRRQNGRKLAGTRAKGGGNRSVMMKLSNEANDLLEVEPINKQRLDFIAASLNEKLNLVKTFDEEIIENCAIDKWSDYC